jgi:hypothetical protein
VASEYPFPGCCVHGFNTHGKTHCLACDCTKLAEVEVTPGPQPAEVEFHVCGVCRAVTVSVDDREAHANWHERQIDTLSNVLTVLQALTARPDRPDRIRAAAQQLKDKMEETRNAQS